MRELSVAEQRYQAVLSVIKDGRTVIETAAAVGVSRQTLHAWLAKYEAGGLEGLVDGSHRPLTSPQQMPATVLEARACHRPADAVLDRRIRCSRRLGGIEPSSNAHNRSNAS
jgi:transposase-like protein